MSSRKSSERHASAAFEVYVSKDTFKFNAAHFVAFKGYRERLHGHNYKIGVRLFGNRQIGADGYVIDFGCIKDVCKKICKQINEHFICPMHSDVLKISTDDTSVYIECEDGSCFQFPLGDCALLPIVHATTEELAIYLYAEILNGLDANYLTQRGLHTMEITVAEAPGQEATFRLAIPETLGSKLKLDVREFIVKGDVIPLPCLNEKQPATDPCCRDCIASQARLTSQLTQLAASINDGTITSGVTPSELAIILGAADA
jgi:dihydroneopterin triphosphate aldolase (PTPS-III) / 6-pyruvoyltetrahydropterin synthase